MDCENSKWMRWRQVSLTPRCGVYVLLLPWRYWTRVTALIRNLQSFEIHGAGEVHLHAPAVGAESHMTGAVHRTHRTTFSPNPRLHFIAKARCQLMRRLSLPTSHLRLALGRLPIRANREPHTTLASRSSCCG